MQESQITEWMKRYDWSRNPFNFRIYPDLMIGYEQEHRRLKDAIESNNKLTLLLGNTGAGKTNMLKSIEQEYQDNVNLFYMSKPPVTEPDLLEYLKHEVLDQSVLSRLLKSYSLYNIHTAINKKYSGQIVLLVDEGHEASIEVLEWLRTAMDHIGNLTVVAAGLPEFEDKLEEDVNTLHSRATEVVRLNSLSRDDTIELIRKRIGYVGGSSIEPFTQDALLKIYRKTGGFPREVLRVCNDCVIHAANEDKSIIDEGDVEKVIDDEEDESSNEPNSQSSEGQESEGEGGERPAGLDELTPKQRHVYDAVEELGEATSGEIVEHMGMEDYQSRSHAIRSINNILRRLMEQNIITRKRKGRNYLYSVDTGGE